MRIVKFPFAGRRYDLVVKDGDFNHELQNPKQVNESVCSTLVCITFVFLYLFNRQPF